jgi:hypothetical protein
MRHPAAGLTLGALVAGTLAVPAAPAVAAPQQRAVSGSSVVGCAYPNDVDADSKPDVAVGVPTEHRSAGAVDVHLSTARSLRLTRGMVAGFGTARAGDEFGYAVAMSEVDSGCPADIVVGAPGEGGAGAVHVVFGAPGGVQRSGGLTFHEPSPRAGDRFGAAVAIDQDDLWIGAPGRSVGGHAAAGAVYHYSIDIYNQGGGISAHLVQTLTQGKGLVGDAPETGDRFGQVISVHLGEAAVGVPLEDVAGKKDAGLVEVLRAPVNAATHNRTGRVSAAHAWTQNSAGVPGGVEAGDRFGAAVSIDRDLAVGVPGEDVGSRSDAGSVQVFRWARGSEHLSPGQLVTQGSAVPGGHLAGYPERGDRFGASVAIGAGYYGKGEPSDLAIGAPGEDVGATSDAGTVSVYALPGGFAPRLLYRGHGLPGARARGDAVGTSLGALTTVNTDGEYSWDNDRVVTGAPGAGGVGIVVAQGGRSFRPLADPRTGLRYGTVVGRHVASS